MTPRQFRGHAVRVTFSDEEHDDLVAASGRTGKSMASLLRNAFLDSQNEADIRASQRERSAFLLRSLFPPDFLKRHGLHPRASTKDILAAAASEIEGPGAPGEHHPGPSGVIPVRPKVSRRRG
jgi:hypothetical protein